MLFRSGKTVKTPVKLGLNDGTRVQILSGLHEGDSIREFVPGAKAPADQCDNAPQGGAVVCVGG